jgi:hypothetical protein
MAARRVSARRSLPYRSRITCQTVEHRYDAPTLNRSMAVWFLCVGDVLQGKL